MKKITLPRKALLTRDTIRALSERSIATAVGATANECGHNSNMQGVRGWLCHVD